MAKAKRLESQCLGELSLKQLKTWLEEDQDKLTSKVRRFFILCLCLFCVLSL